MSISYAPLLALAITTSAFGQITYPFPDSAATWVNTNYSIIPFPPPGIYSLNSVELICVNGTDTLIDGISYTQVRHCGGSYKGAWRDDAGVVYYVPGDSLQEFVLYDFTLEAGGAATVYYEANGQATLQEVEISDVNTSTEYGGTRKVLQLTSGARWIEGIGPTWGLFTEPWVNVSNYELRLECMSQEDSVRYPVEEVGEGTCSFVMGLDERAAPSTLTLQPNPTQGTVRMIIPGLRVPARVDVLDAQGRTVLSVPQVMTDGSMDFSTLPDGVYAVHVINHGMRSVQRLVVQH